MLMSSRSAVSRHICSQPRRRRRSSRSRITPGCRGGGHWVTQGAPSHHRAGAQQPVCLRPLERAASSAPTHTTPGRCSSPLVLTSLSCLTSAFPSLPVPSDASAGRAVGLQGPPRQPTLTRVEAASQGRPRFVVFPQVAQIPVALVLHQPNHLLV